mgnify:CR=1 FL=1
MKAIFLCGGSGKRMFPITEDKFLLKFIGKTLLEHQIEIVRRSGLNEFIIIGNPHNIGKIEEIIRNLPMAKFDLAIQKNPLGIADALRCAKRFLNDETIVVNPNDLSEASAYTSLIEAYNHSSAASYLLGYEVKDYFPGGYLVVDENSNLKHIVEKPEEGKEPSNLVNILVHLHTNPEQLLEYAEKVETTRDDVYERALDSMVKDGHEIKVVPYAGFWIPIKYPWHIFKAAEHFLDNATPYVSPTARISDKATIEGRVILGDNVKVLENAVIRGPAYIGPNSVIGNNALVRDYSHIGANCVVGYSTEVKHSYIGDNCWFHSNYIGDSIIDDDCSFGAGTILANFRFDEGNICIEVGGSKVDTGYDKLGAIVGKGCRTGINASLMPGIRVGSNSFVGPQLCLNQDLEANKMALLESQYQVLNNKTKLAQDKRQDLLRKLTG